MSGKTITIILLLIILVVAAVAAVFYFRERQAIAQIQTFEECVQNGFPVQESYPRRCSTPDGRSFVEEITPTPEPQPLPQNNKIIIDEPKPNSTLTSPFTFTGEARGTWYFEASFPVELVDSAGNRIAIAIATAEGEWMTENFVPFSGTMTFKATTTTDGFLIFHKDNPSGLPEFDDQVRIPVRIQK